MSECWIGGFGGMLLLYWDCFLDYTGLHWDHFGITLGLHWGNGQFLLCALWVDTTGLTTLSTSGIYLLLSSRECWLWPTGRPLLVHDVTTPHHTNAPRVSPTTNTPCST